MKNAIKLSKSPGLRVLLNISKCRKASWVPMSLLIFQGNLRGIIFNNLKKGVCYEEYKIILIKCTVMVTPWGLILPTTELKIAGILTQLVGVGLLVLKRKDIF